MTLTEALRFHHRYTLPPALALLPLTMDTLQARAMLLAIGAQESRFRDRHQIKGPARGFWQFELGGGVAEVLTNPVTRPFAERAVEELRYIPAVNACYLALEHNDVLAAVFARLFLFTHPARLPLQTQPEAGWRQYVETWRPGVERPQEWRGHYDRAWAIVLEG